jgi:hypothetical protein
MAGAVYKDLYVPLLCIEPARKCDIYIYIYWGRYYSQTGFWIILKTVKPKYKYKFE